MLLCAPTTVKGYDTKGGSILEIGDTPIVSCDKPKILNEIGRVGGYWDMFFTIPEKLKVFGDDTYTFTKRYSADVLYRDNVMGKHFCFLYEEDLGTDPLGIGGQKSHLVENEIFFDSIWKTSNNIGESWEITRSISSEIYSGNEKYFSASISAGISDLLESEVLIGGTYSTSNTRIHTDGYEISYKIGKNAPSGIYTIGQKVFYRKFIVLEMREFYSSDYEKWNYYYTEDSFKRYTIKTINYNDYTEKEFISFHEDNGNKLCHVKIWNEFLFDEDDEMYKMECIGVNKGYLGFPVFSTDTKNSLEVTKLIGGRAIDEMDTLTHSRVININKSYAEFFFGKGKGIGETVEIGKDKYLVVGILDDTNDVLRSIKKMDLDAPTLRIYVPYSLAPSYAQKSCVVRFESEQDIILSSSILVQYFTRSVVTFDLIENEKSLDSLIKTISVSFSLISGVIVLVIMVFNIRERVFEFAVKQAVGATSDDIRMNVLCESIIYGVLGSLIGIILGIIISYISCIYLFLSTGVMSFSRIEADKQG